MTRIPKPFREIAYKSADGLLAWPAEKALELVEWMSGNGLAPAVAEAWMVFAEGGFAGTHTPIIYHDADTSSFYRWQLDSDYSSAEEAWEAYQARAIRDAAAFIRQGHAEARVHPNYSATIHYHLEWRGPEATE